MRGNARRYAGLVAGLAARRLELCALMDKARVHALQELGAAASGDLSHLRLHPADEASDVAEQATDLALCNAESAEVDRIDAALRRAHAGLYGICEVCGREIEWQRLEAAPESLRCIDCAEFAEQEGAGFAPAYERKTLRVQPLAAAEEDLNVMRVEEAEIERAMARTAGEPEVEEAEALDQEATATQP